MRRIAIWSAAGLAAGIAIAGFFGAAQPAAAQQGFGNYFGYQSQKPRRRAQRRARPSAPEQETAEKKKKDAKPDAGPSGPVYVVISIGDQHVSVYDRTGRIARSRVSTGMRGHATPTGVFSVIGKERYHHSNIYSGAPMPWMQRITWSGVAMHAGVVPGYPASHGCIRLPYSFAPQLWKMTQMGARVVVARNDTVPFEISHSLLPTPFMQPAPAGAQQALQAPESPVELASMSTPTQVAMATSAVTDGTSSGSAASTALNPIAYAAALKEQAKTDKKAADAVAKAALEAAQTAGAEARQAVADMAKAKADIAVAEAKLAELDASVSAPRSDKAADADTVAKAEAAMAMAKTAANSELIRARAALDEALRRESVKTPTAFRAVEVWKAAAAASATAAETLKEADRRVEPVSVFISKKEGRIFIRQDWKEVYEAPVTIRDPDRPLGTHVFIATDAEPDGSAMRWSAISVPPEAARTGDRRPKASKGAPETPVTKAGADTSGPETAAGALDRIELPEEARKRISELLWTGASLIVSDHTRSDEMDEYTDFIVLTR